MAVKAKSGENLTDTAIEKVITHLENGGTKKEACQILNIAYNTARLTRIIKEYQEKKEHNAKMRKIMRSKPLDISDKKYIVESYLSGIAINEIADGIFRSTQVVKNVLRNYNVPLRTEQFSYFSPLFLPENSIREEYKKGDLVYSAKYGVPAFIDKKIGESELGPVYRLWLTGKHAKWAYQPYYELADFTKLQNELNIHIHEMDEIEIKQLIYEALTKAKKYAK